jgi:uncharacterized protein (DUF427 family)
MESADEFAAWRAVGMNGAPVHLEPSPRWVRVRLNGETIADSRRALLLIQYGPGRLPTYYFPPADVRLDCLQPAHGAVREFAYQHVTAGGRLFENAAWTYADPPAHLSTLKDHVSFNWDRSTSWYEEDEQVFVHARDPHKRVDVLLSSRHVRVVVAGQTVADSRRPHLLFETSLPARYYLPREDVRLDLLEPSTHRTRCPYKGKASYWSVRVGSHLEPDLVWSYPDPIPECPRIKDLLCFFDERVDLYVDGEVQPRPRTPWSP